MAKNKDEIVKKGGNELWYKEVNEDGSNLSPTPATWATLGHIQESEFNDETEFEKTYNEAGELVGIDEGNREPQIKGLLMQSSKTILDFLGKGCRDKYFAIYKYEGIVNKKHQELWIAVAQIRPLIQLKSGTKRPPIEITAMKVDSAVTITTTLPSVAKASTATIPANDYWVITETAVS